MTRIAGVDLPKGKRIQIALTYIFGIGKNSAREILYEAGIDGNKKTEAINDTEVTRIREIIDTKYKIEGDLRRQVAMDIKRLMDLGTYRGLRHRKGLPARGQRTHTNARTRKGPRRGVLGKKKAK